MITRTHKFLTPLVILAGFAACSADAKESRPQASILVLDDLVILLGKQINPSMTLSRLWDRPVLESQTV